MATLKTQTPGGAFGGVDVDNIRRTFGIGDKVAELAPETSIFFSYLSKLGKKSTDDTVWKPLEYRNQWQRRNMTVTGTKLTIDGTSGGVTGNAVPSGADLSHFIFSVDYQNTGQINKSANLDVLAASDAYVGYAPIFLSKGQVFRAAGINYKIAEDATILYFTYTATDGATASTKAAAGKGGTDNTTYGYAAIAIADISIVSTGAAVANDNWTEAVGELKGQVAGSQWSEASGAPDGWRDELSAVEFYTQIFKTSVPLMSGSMMATKYRGYANEWKRIYAEHLKSHKMDLEQAFLFGYGKYVGQDQRSSWGMVPFLEGNGGKRYQLDYDTNAAGTSDGTYDVKAGFSYDGIIDVMDDFMNWEGGNSGQKLCLTSRKVINALHRVGDGNFLSNSFSNAAGNAAGRTAGLFEGQLQVKTSSFMPIDITSISTSWGSMNFVAHPLFRGDMVDKAVCVDLSNVSLRPLAANGISRDTFVETNIQENDIDGRKDQIITEAGLEVLLPETHATIDFV